MKNKIHIVIGTKAQLIKMAPVMAELEKRKTPYNFIFTGQHQETMDQLRENFSIKKPDIILHKGTDITGMIQMLFWLTKISFKVLFNKKTIFGKTSKNDFLLTHGDTFSTVLGALMGRLAGMKVAHIESGLRSFNMFHPFPEEINRLLTFRLSTHYFCPGKWAVNNLKKYKGEKINTELNTLYDSLQLAIRNAHKATVKIPKEKYCVCSIHRFENIFKKKVFESIIKNIENIANEHKVLFILHPPTIQQIKKFNFEKRLKTNKNIDLRPRYDYLNFINLLNKSEFLITDGGSNQEEAFYLGKPCLLMRNTTERKEGIGRNVVISKYNKETIKQFICRYKTLIIPSTHTIKSPSQIIISHL